MAGQVHVEMGASAGGCNHRESDKLRDDEQIASCKNCSAPLTGQFCADCGQRAHHASTLAEVGHEILHGITHFDSKTWTTLPLLLFRPGKLTRDYLDGKRSRYIAPVPLFLLVVFVMFFVLGFVSVDDQFEVSKGDPAMAVRDAEEIDTALADLDSRIAAARQRGALQEAASLANGREALVRLRDDRERRARGEVGMSVTERLSAEIEAGVANGALQANTGVATLDRKIDKALRNPSLMLYKLQTKAYKLSFLLVPLSLPWLWLMFFWRRGVRLYDHAVFALYSISFMSLLFVAGSIALAAHVTSQWFWLPLAVVVPLAHMFAQLRGTYRLSVAGSS